ncbi:hypothetical protein [Nocardioides sp. B-3]|uniref:hypothetical protein n=1 Tax=Nocardioides sp. B-3 TaxID=2895565 RepID=UPI002153198E|nr:hypothetical protein [Nocardioides sp. B-3]UUZ59412.1 hypothetical protein LP418_27045 [Nocardioides sp. B-3]
MNRKILPVPQPRPTIAPSVDRAHQNPGYPVRERIKPPTGAPERARRARRRHGLRCVVGVRRSLSDADG